LLRINLKKLLVILFFFYLTLAFSGVKCCFSQVETGAVEIKAVSLSYYPSESKVVGEGDVLLKHEGINVWADKIVYFADKGEAFAEALLGRFVRISKDGHILYGKKLYYNFMEKRGFIEDAEAEEAGVIFKGKRFEVSFIDIIPRDKFLFFRTKPEKLPQPDFEISLVDARFTTCKLFEPTYFVSGDRIVIYPNGKVKVVKPSLFLGGKKVISLPFDYNFSVKKAQIFMLMPSVGFTSTLGWYGGMSVESFYNHFTFSFNLLYSEKQGLVGRAKVGFKISESSEASLGLERSEDWDTFKMRWRTDLSFELKEDKFKFRLNYLKDKKYWVLRDDEDVKTIYSATPEVYVKYALNPFLFFVRFGSYEEYGINRDKLTLGAALDVERKLGSNISVSSKLIYLKDYYDGGDEREIAYYYGLLAWKLDGFTIKGGYMERKVFGHTPFYFDKYDPLRKYLLGFETSLGDVIFKSYLYYDDLNESLRDLKGEISFNLKGRLYFSLKPWFYLDEGKWREIDYGLTYYLCPCGCTSLRIDFHDDMRKENDDVLWLRLYLYPSSLSLVSGSVPEEDSLIPP